MPYAQAHVEIIERDDHKTITLFSYSTAVCIITDNILTVTGLYSMTTRKHISAFMREYTPCDYATAKQLYTDHKKMDITTGEITNLDE